MECLLVTRVLGNRGGNIVIASLAHELLAQGVELDIVAFKPEGTEDYPDCEPLYRGLDIDIKSIPARDDEPAQMKEYIDAAAKVLRERQHQYKTIILDSWYVALAGIMAQVDTDRTFQLVQSQPAFTPPNSSKIWEARVFDMLPLYPMQRIVVSRMLQELFHEHYGVDYPKIDLYVNDAYRQADFEVIDRPTVRFVAAASDFTIPTKGLVPLLDSFDTYAAGPFELTLVSGKPIPAEMLAGYNYPTQVTYAATPDDMVAILQKQDVFVSTSTRESFGLTLAEALTLGMPAVTLDSVGNRDYAKNDNCIFVPDPTDLTSQLERAAALDVRRTLHERARPSMARYTLANMTRQFRELTGI